MFAPDALQNVTPGVLRRDPGKPGYIKCNLLVGELDAGKHVPLRQLREDFCHISCPYSVKGLLVDRVRARTFL